MLLDYSTAATVDLPPVQGTMVYGAGRLGSPPLTLPLPVQGCYTIYIACWHDIHMGGSRLRLRLSEDQHWRQLEPEVMSPKDGDFPGRAIAQGDITEVFWRVAELSSSALIIDRVRTWAEPSGRGDQAVDKGACLAWVRLEPASEQDRDRYQGRGRTQTPAPQFAQYDNGGWWQKGCQTVDDLHASLDWFAGTDQWRINWGCFSNEGACYPSEVAQQMGRDPEVTRCIDEFVRRGIDPLQVALEYADTKGLSLYPSYRIGGKRPAPTIATTNEMPFFDSHQHCLCVTAEGTPTCHYSFAYPEVRDYFTSVLREVVENYDVPGVHFLFIRSNPFALYEEKTVDEFKAIHGQDPRTLPEDDATFWQHRANYATQFVRQLREMLDKVGKSQGKHLELSVAVPPLGNGPTWCIDGATWAREGLVDWLTVHAGGILPLEAVGAYRQAIEGSKTPLIVDFYPRRMPACDRLRRAVDYYEAGADGFCFWDSQARVVRASEFATDRFLGHREDLLDWAEQMPDTFRVIPLDTLQGYTMDRRYWTLTSG
ncbi:MAG TPA: family 10 glycosylhydrolase [Candidatus Latescibacteria bacterium]|jgi:hypothetical protein|nr:family 10 glycosylhydrolase [Candidatus Latescibacterota bacterium]MDP7631508.1 family 10 glycosylhydrolase [Candidatus Latescibacterota bacterium]HJN28390.1 family 10 glycosylhydrolase [Candidatus Latescibacterota bacterium]